MKQKLTTFFRNEIKGWTALELLWLGLATTVILALSLYWKDSLMGIVSALTGVWCVIFTGKGKTSSFLFGTVNALLYAIIAYRAAYYGEVMLNLLYYLPCNVLGVILWNRHNDPIKGEVIKKRLSLKASLLVYPLTAAAVVGYGFVLKALGGALPFVDSLSTVLSIVAQILCLKRYAEQWILWIVVNAVTIVMWLMDFLHGGESIATLIMWTVFFLNSIFMYSKWYRDVKRCAMK